MYIYIFHGCVSLSEGTLNWSQEALFKSLPLTILVTGQVDFPSVWRESENSGRLCSLCKACPAPKKCESPFRSMPSRYDIPWQSDVTCPFWTSFLNLPSPFFSSSFFFSCYPGGIIQWWSRNDGYARVAELLTHLELSRLWATQSWNIHWASKICQVLC